MNRRSIFSGLLLGAAAPFLGSPEAEASIPKFKEIIIPTKAEFADCNTLDKINQAFAQEGWHYSDWKSGFALFWTGWKPAQNYTFLAAQWCATTRKAKPPRNYYASTPGAAGAFERGDCFDISHPRDVQKVQDVFYLEDCRNNPEELRLKLAKIKTQCFERLLKVMRKHGEAV